jgi:hypothetical protein
MQMPLDIRFRDMTPSPALAESIGSWARKLDDVIPLQRCAVVVEKPNGHHRHGGQFVIHLDITVPGHEIVVSRDRQVSHADPYAAVADAFRAARRQLVELNAQRREARPPV